MIRFVRFLFLLSLVAVSACQSVEQLSIDYQMPADVSFPPALRRVGIVNNMPDMVIDSTATNQEEAAPSLSFGLPDMTAEALAQTLAEANYFDEVIICDSALRAHDDTLRTSYLEPYEVEQLSQELGTDFLLAVEKIHILTRRKVTHYPEVGLYEGTVDAMVSPLVRIYIPGRKGPMTSLHPVDSIYWESTSPTLSAAMNRLTPEAEVRQQASDFAGEMIVKRLLPYWKKAQRHLFIGSGVAMRDAAVCAREADWQKAVTLWKQSYNAKSAKTRMQAAYNLALGYEMQDSIRTALQWAKQAQALAREVEKVDAKQADGTPIPPSTIPYFIMTGAYVTELEQREAAMPLLEMQSRNGQ